eukprot:3815593-Pyramimonas_sp.AAC.1
MQRQGPECARRKAQGRCRCAGGQASWTLGAGSRDVRATDMLATMRWRSLFEECVPKSKPQSRTPGS